MCRQRQQRAGRALLLRTPANLGFERSNVSLDAGRNQPRHRIEYLAHA
jgi:hypothetical protein